LGHAPSLTPGTLFTYEKAFLGQADKGKFPKSTFLERKIMSTKTSFKRIALVAASALALGGFSVISAPQASAGTTPTIAAISGTNSTGGTALTAPTATATVGAYVVDTITAGSADKVYTITSTGVGTLSIAAPGAALITSTEAGAVTNVGSADSQQYQINSSTSATWYAGTPTAAFPGASVFTGGDSEFTFAATSSVAGVQTITVTGDTGASVKQTITWGAAPVVSVNNTTAYTTTTANALSDTIATANTASAALAANTPLLIVRTASGGTPTAAIGVTLKNTLGSTGTAMPAATLTATVTGVGLVDGYTAANLSGGGAFNNTPAKSASVTTDSSGVATFQIMADGTSGTSSIAITYTDALGVTTTLSTKTVTFYSTTVAKLAVTQNYSVATAGTTLGASDATNGSGALTVAVTDSSGNPVAGRTNGTSASVGFFVTSDNTACITSTIGTTTEGDSAAGNNSVGTYEINLSGAGNALSGCKANVTVSYYNTALSTITSAPIAFTVGGTTINALTLTADKAEYAPGEKITYRITATDSSGNPIADGAYGVFNAVAATTAVNGLTMTAVTTAVPFAKAAATGGANTNLSFVGGYAESSTFAPYASGDLTASFTTNATSASLLAAIRGQTLTSVITVGETAAGSAASLALDAANAATDAANNAYDEAQNATQAASDALAAVTALAAQVKTLIASVKKLTKAVAKLS